MASELQPLGDQTSPYVAALRAEGGVILALYRSQPGAPVAPAIQAGTAVGLSPEAALRLASALLVYAEHHGPLGDMAEFTEVPAVTAVFNPGS